MPFPTPGDLPDPGIEPRSPALGFSGNSVSKESACCAGDLGSIPGSGRSPGEGNGKGLFQCVASLQRTGASVSAPVLPVNIQG